MYGWEFFHGGWLWLIPVVFMLLICFLMMRGGIMRGCMRSMLGDHDHYHDDAESPSDIAARRYAAGEISEEEYDRIVNTLTRK